MFHVGFGMGAAGGLSRSSHSVPPMFLFLIFLAGCASAPPPAIGNENPANPAAERGFAEVPAALDAYKSAADFAARNSEPAGTMEGMEHGAMPGMSGKKADDGSMDKPAPAPAPNRDQNMVTPSGESKKSSQPGAHHE